MRGPGSELYPFLNPAASYQGSTRSFTLVTGLGHAYLKNV
jgi:hypothetical protein